jgi:hypothetical protein
MTYTRAVPMSRITHTPTPLLGHIMYLPQHMVVVGTSTLMSLRKISTSSIIITRRHVTMPIPSVRTISLFNDALRSSVYIEAYSSQPSASSQKSKSNFEQKCASALTDFHTNSRGFAKTLHNLGADKGREHYDEYDPIERLIKDDIDLHKDVLGYVNELCRRYPSVCLYLGPSTSRYLPLYTAPIVLILLSHLRYQVHSGRDA